MSTINYHDRGVRLPVWIVLSEDGLPLGLFSTLKEAERAALPWRPPVESP